jgi:lipid-A-disaccharide synthase
MSPAPRLAFVAGEASGDMLAAHVLSGLKSRHPGLLAFGIGGPNMLGQGFQTWWPQERLAVRGYVEVLRHYPGLWAMRQQLAKRLLHDRPDAFIGVDAPDFNIGLERKLREGGVKTIHFICPSIWAWRPERIHAIKRSVDHMLCVFPFEPALLQQHGVHATYVGHPLADAIAVPLQDPAPVRAMLGLDRGGPVVALLPGSRASEVQAMGALFVQAAKLMHRARSDLQFVLPCAPGREAQVQAIVDSEVQHLPIKVLKGQSHEALIACDVTLIASGTATLEAALFKRPMVIAYRMNALSYRWMKGKALQPWIGLPNILARESLVPERVQHEATPEVLAKDTLAWLDQHAARENLTQRFMDMHHQLKRDTARAATDAIAKTLAS